MSDYVPTIDDLRVKLCFICREEETYDKPENPPRKWTHPCQCTLLAHEECLLEWIKTAQTKSSTTAAENALKCPQCGAKYHLESDLPPGMRIVNSALTAWNKSLGRLGKLFIALVPAGMVAGVAVGTHFVLTQYGAYAVKEFFGEEVYEAVLTSNPHNLPVSARINLPLIPIGLICYRFNTSYNLFPAISTLLEWPSLHRRNSSLSTPSQSALAWPPSPFTVGFIAMPLIRYLYGICLQRVTRWVLGPSSSSLQRGLRRAAGDTDVAVAGDDGEEDRMLMIRIRNANGEPAENNNAGGGEGNRDQTAITIYASPLGRKIGGALLIPLIARRMGNLLLKVSKHSELLRRFLGVRSAPAPTSSWKPSSLFSAGKSLVAPQPVTWKLVLRAIWGGGRAWAEFDPIWWRNTLGFGLFVVAKDALHLLHLYLVKKEVETRRVKNRDFRDVDVSGLEIIPRAEGDRRWSI
ncbi:hypothetical protein V5O48_012493 [Marasmius crinis-equi]|uniref:RING-CH-type domain-containing protein n=1 Tax=Marasmius crinis-equi TaxID=585013 RepID=A0ABR3F2L1_9AGAR